MRKKSNRKPITPNYATFHNIVQANSRVDLSTGTVDKMMLRPYAKLRALRTNDLDLDGFIELNQINCTGFCLAAYIHKEGDEATKAVLGSKQVVFEKAADALQEIGIRFGKIGKMRALPDEFDKISQSILLLDQLYAVSTKGVAYRAIEQARLMVDEKLKESTK